MIAHLRAWLRAHDARLLLALIAVGMLTRVIHLLFIPLDIPYAAGGLFAEFATQIAQGGYALPRQIPYVSDGGIPYAYPPLPFYLAALLIDVFGINDLTLFNILPPIIGALTVPAFAALIRALGLDRREQIVALGLYIVLPVAYIEFLYGEGLAEASGGLAIIVLGIALVRWTKTPTWGAALAAGAAWAISVLASPGSAFGALPTVAVFALYRWEQTYSQTGTDSRRAGLLRVVAQVIVMGVLALLLTAPYWVTVAHHHGFGVFTRTFGDQYEGGVAESLWARVEFLLTFDVTRVRFGVLWNTLMFASVGYVVIMRRMWLLPAWYILLLAIPREGLWMAPVPGAMIAGITVLHGILPRLTHAVTALRDDHRDDSTPPVPLLVRIGAVCVGVLLLVHSAGVVVDHPALMFGRTRQQEDSYVMSPAILEALEWSRDHLPPDAHLVILYNGTVEDWAPHIARRTITGERYGTEWEPEEHDRALAMHDDFRACESLDCVTAALHESYPALPGAYMFISPAVEQRIDLDAASAFVRDATVFRNAEVRIMQVTLVE